MEHVIPAYKNLVDVLQDAVDKESDAEQFYREAAELALEPELKNFLLNLASMEGEHYELLKGKLELLKANSDVMYGIMSSFGDEER